jgi:hypothetical protein
MAMIPVGKKLFIKCHSRVCKKRPDISTDLEELSYKKISIENICTTM